MKKNKKEMTGVQMLSEYCGHDVTTNPTMYFLAIVCRCLSSEEVKDLFGLSNWEYKRIFKDDFKEGYRWLRSAKRSFKTLDKHIMKQNLDACQDELSQHLWGWARGMYIYELSEALEESLWENPLEGREDNFEFNISAEELNEIGLLIMLHYEEATNPETIIA